MNVTSFFISAFLTIEWTFITSTEEHLFWLLIVCTVRSVFLVKDYHYVNSVNFLLCCLLKTDTFLKNMMGLFLFIDISIFCHPYNDFRSVAERWYVHINGKHVGCLLWTTCLRIKYFNRENKIQQETCIVLIVHISWFFAIINTSFTFCY